jgi:hypothetical protein
VIFENLAGSFIVSGVMGCFLRANTFSLGAGVTGMESIFSILMLNSASPGSYGVSYSYKLEFGAFSNRLDPNGLEFLREPNSSFLTKLYKF